MLIYQMSKARVTQNISMAWGITEISCGIISWATARNCRADNECRNRRKPKEINRIVNSSILIRRSSMREQKQYLIVAWGEHMVAIIWNGRKLHAELCNASPHRNKAQWRVK